MIGTIISADNQMILLLTTIYGGFILGLFFDMYRLIKDKLQLNRVFTCIGDMIFWIVSSVIILIIVYRSSSGLLRAYQLIGFVTGVGIYTKLFSRYVVGLLYIVGRYIRRLFFYFIKVIKIPFILMTAIILVPYNKVIKKYINKCIYLFKNKKDE